MVSSLLQLGIAQSFSKPLHAAVASTAASGEKATAATGRSSAISLHCARARRSAPGPAMHLQQGV